MFYYVLDKRLYCHNGTVVALFYTTNNLSSQ